MDLADSMHVGRICRLMLWAQMGTVLDASWRASSIGNLTCRLVSPDGRFRTDSLEIYFNYLPGTIGPRHGTYFD